jgi:predicted amidophosphoribosyltransferase
MRALLDLLVPSRCAGCQRDGPPLCPNCQALLGQPLRVRLDGRGLPPVYAVGRYRGPLRTAVLAYKERGRRELARPLGESLAGGIRQLLLADGALALDGAWNAAAGRWLVPVPSRSAAARRRGGDHVLRLAKQTARALSGTGLPAAVAPALRLASGVRDSVGLDAAARSANLAGRLRTRPTGLPPPGTAVVLLDDVATTGATAAACTATLAAAEVEVHAVLVLASAAPLLRTGGIRDRSVTVRHNRRTVGFMTV